MMASLGDWFDPSCTPGTAGCVPHWYCYIPLMATPDCVQSFGVGVSEIASDIASPIVGTATAAVGGAASGLASGVATGLGSSVLGTVLIIGGIAAALYFLKR